MSVERLRARLHYVGALEGRYNQWAKLRQEIVENAPPETVAISTEMVIQVSDRSQHDAGLIGSTLRLEGRYLESPPEVDHEFPL